MLEVLTALGMAVVLSVGFSATLRSQTFELSVASQRLKAREALLDAQEKLQAGLIQPAARGAVKALPAPRPLKLTCERLPNVDPRLIHADLVPVLLRARWTDVTGTPLERSLTVLVPRRGR